MSPTPYGAGDAIFFKDGAQAQWHVQGHPKTCRNSRVIGKIRRMRMPAGGRKAATLMGSNQRMLRPRHHHGWRRFARTSTTSRQSKPSAALPSPSQ